ncbi:MAG: HAD-IC family P-type ATPase, partial [Candidatus Micrarchaeota archaeon]|nr:HAD-IC family P-type ATPase [Candidatus Micrarchaeota archaeon]
MDIKEISERFRRRMMTGLGNGHRAQTEKAARMNTALCEAAGSEIEEVLKKLGTGEGGLTSEEAVERLEKYGPNKAVKEKRRTVAERLFEAFSNPVVILLLVLAFVSFFTSDVEATIIILFLVLVSVAIRFFLELRADNSAEKLKAMVSTTATVIRDGLKKEVPLKALVPGDVIHLSVGDMVPADVRLISSKDLFVNQATLTGESVPAEKHAPREAGGMNNPLEMSNLCFMGTAVESGTANAVVVSTGADTYFGCLASSVSEMRVVTSFDRGINDFAWLMVKFVLIMAPLVFLLNGLTKGDWFEAFLFSLSVAVGLTPEMLPMIVTVNLAKGAMTMSKKKVIVKRLNSIQNIGAIDVLCTDKTGTITQGVVILEKHIDIHGHESEEVIEYAYLNSFYQTGLKNLL